ncbi:hypothetical protein PtA15_4A172 [Puccinia triticina]|uniref:Secreted protein n=1 Tax=Puccinia triticina TaxID=208348 RepID=A0ABY7CGE2_9BASI|nr:uncharacterized protein PtA15_4A172 [Puccinia triticina]WAQ83724.1 hypothetical protein PtA15_4A172 [Puccinia triticina]
MQAPMVFLCFAFLALTQQGVLSSYDRSAYSNAAAARRAKAAGTTRGSGKLQFKPYCIFPPKKELNI